MSSLSEALVQVVEQGTAAVLATVIEVEGHDGVEAGAKCLIRDGQVRAETIGDAGVVEAMLHESAVHLQEEKSKLVSLNMPAGGGKLEVFFEVLPAPPKLVVVGAGHIAVPLVKMAKVLDFRVIVTDDRLAYANRERFPEAADVYAEEYEDVFPKLAVNESSYIVIVTRGHRDDMRVLRWAIDTRARYISMIGSKRKTIGVVKELEKEGIARAAFDRVYAPMGLEIGAVSPEEIAISVGAEMIAMRRDPEGNWRSLSKSIFADEHLRALLK